MSLKHIHSNELPDLLFSIERSIPYSCYSNKKHPSQFGMFTVSGIRLPNLNVMDVGYHVADDLLLHDSDASNTIDINFMLQDSMYGDFSGINKQFLIRGGQHNMKFTPGEKHKHKMLRDGALRMFHLALEPQFLCDLIGFNDAWSERMQRRIQLGENFMVSDHFLKITPAMYALIYAIQNHVDEGNINRLRIHSMLFELLSLQIDQFKSGYHHSNIEVPVKEDVDKLYCVKQYIENHFLEDMTLESLCKIGMLNEFKLKKGFKNLFNTSVIQYVRQLRMEYAERLLKDYNKNIEEVSLILGYHYPQHFSTAYKKYFGSCPSQKR